MTNVLFFFSQKNDLHMVRLFLIKIICCNESISTRIDYLRYILNRLFAPIPNKNRKFYDKTIKKTEISVLVEIKNYNTNIKYENITDCLFRLRFIESGFLSAGYTFFTDFN